MIIKCPKCGYEIEGPNKPGRKSYDIDFNNISKALQEGLSDAGRINQSNAARILSEELGRRITPGFISNRINKEAELRRMNREQLVDEIIRGCQ